jgi:hypothetical protein
MPAVQSFLKGFFYIDFFLPKITSTTNIKAAISSNKFIRLPPILKIRPINQKTKTIPPSHLKKII